MLECQLSNLLSKQVSHLYRNIHMQMYIQHTFSSVGCSCNKSGTKLHRKSLQYFVISFCFYCLHACMTTDIPPPELGSISRRSAQEIEISWSVVVDDNYPITGYVVKYRPITILQKRNAEDLPVLIETNETNLVISDLDPRIAYGVSVAARNRAGLGNFTEEALTECKRDSRDRQPN